MALWDVVMVALIASATMVLPLAWVLLERIVAAQRAISMARARLDEVESAIGGPIDERSPVLIPRPRASSPSDRPTGNRPPGNQQLQ